MRHIHVVFLEGIRIEKNLDALARRQLAFAVLGVDTALAAAGPCLRPASFDLFKYGAHKFLPVFP
ncbi:hypothetical protein D3C72_1687630 [compost metagenome]